MNLPYEVLALFWWFLFGGWMVVTLLFASCAYLYWYAKEKS